MAHLNTKYYRSTPSGSLGFTDDLKLDGQIDVEFLVTFSDRSDGLLAALNAPGVPLYGSHYEFAGESHPALILAHKRGDRVADNSPVWRVTCEYRVLTPEEQEQQEDPEFELPIIRGRFEKRQEIIYVNRVRTGLAPVQNSAGQVFNDPPPTHEVSFPILSITRNESIFRDVPGICRRYADAVNSDSYFGASPGECKMQSITWEIVNRMTQGGSLQRFYKVTYEIAHREEGWRLHLVDAGKYYFDEENNKLPFLDDFGHVYEGLLDGQGGQVIGEPAVPVFLPAIKHYPELPYSALNLPQGANF